MTSEATAGGIPVSVGAAVQRGPFSWMRNAGIVKLNCVLVLSLISSYATGFDGSMVSLLFPVLPSHGYPLFVFGNRYPVSPWRRPTH
jgi:hypothetical protein